MKLEKIHKDKRGIIRALHDIRDLNEITLIETRAGAARGGCIHPEVEYLVVVKGKISLCAGTSEYLLGEGNVIIIHAGTPHYYVSLSNSLIIEWPKSSTEYDDKFRKIVEKINAGR